MKITVDDNTNMINIECDDKKQAVNIVEWILSNKSNATVKCIDDAEIIYQKGFSEAEAITKELVDFCIHSSSLVLNDVFNIPIVTTCEVLKHYSLLEIHKRISDYKSRENVNGD